jgi:hypothetical protein
MAGITRQGIDYTAFAVRKMRTFASVAPQFSSVRLRTYSNEIPVKKLHKKGLPWKEPAVANL